MFWIIFGISHNFIKSAPLYPLSITKEFKTWVIHEPGKDWFRLYTYHSLSCASGCYLEQFAPFEGCAHYFVDCWSRAQKMLKSKVLELISSSSEAVAKEFLNPSSWNSFVGSWRRSQKNIQIRTPGCHFVDFWSQGQKIFESKLQELMLSTSCAWPSKYLSRNVWNSFCRLLETRPEHV